MDKYEEEELKARILGERDIFAYLSGRSFG